MRRRHLVHVVHFAVRGPVTVERYPVPRRNAFLYIFSGNCGLPFSRGRRGRRCWRIGRLRTWKRSARCGWYRGLRRHLSACVSVRTTTQDDQNRGADEKKGGSKIATRLSRLRETHLCRHLSPCAVQYHSLPFIFRYYRKRVRILARKPKAPASQPRGTRRISKEESLFSAKAQIHVPSCALRVEL